MCEHDGFDLDSHTVTPAPLFPSFMHSRQFRFHVYLRQYLEPSCAVRRKQETPNRSMTFTRKALATVLDSTRARRDDDASSLSTACPGCRGLRRQQRRYLETPSVYDSIAINHTVNTITRDKHSNESSREHAMYNRNIQTCSDTLLHHITVQSHICHGSIQYTSQVTNDSAGITQSSLHPSTRHSKACNISAATHDKASIFVKACTNQ